MVEKKEKMMMIKPLADIVYGGVNHKKGSESFEITEDLGKRLVDGKKATVSE